MNSTNDTHTNYCIQCINHAYTAGEDYSTIAVVLEFQPGETLKQITVNITNDKKTEGNETFLLHLTAGQGVQLSASSRTEITIENDDGKPIAYSSIYYSYIQSNKGQLCMYCRYTCN